MTVLYDIFNIILPDYLVHGFLEFADRLKTQHFNILCLALFTLGLDAQVGQAGIGATLTLPRPLIRPVRWARQ